MSDLPVIGGIKGFLSGVMDSVRPYSRELKYGILTAFIADLVEKCDDKLEKSKAIGAALKTHNAFSKILPSLEGMIPPDQLDEWKHVAEDPEEAICGARRSCVIWAGVRALPMLGFALRSATIVGLFGPAAVTIVILTPVLTKILSIATQEKLKPLDDMVSIAFEYVHGALFIIGRFSDPVSLAEICVPLASYSLIYTSKKIFDYVLQGQTQDPAGGMFSIGYIIIGSDEKLQMTKNFVYLEALRVLSGILSYFPFDPTSNTLGKLYSYKYHCKNSKDEKIQKLFNAIDRDKIEATIQNRNEISEKEIPRVMNYTWLFSTLENFQVKLEALKNMQNGEQNVALNSIITDINDALNEYPKHIGYGNEEDWFLSYLFDVGTKAVNSDLGIV